MSRDPSQTLELPRHYLTIGQGVVCEAPTTVLTVLGSCVSVTMYSKQRKIGGVFHALMPRWADHENGTQFNVYKYVDSSVDSLLKEMNRRGIPNNSLECKVFGGASALFPHEMSVGDRNVRAALDALFERKVRIRAMDVGGEQGRKLLFLTHTGEVFIKRIASHSRENLSALGNEGGEP